ncbi:MAG: glycosyltransferase, partial [Thermodesulfobacteriota bacterium]|nr:glycosyltransferase [Thermodesulfobacteriota bacterium]
DGGSTDGTAEIIERYAERHPHIRWVSEEDKGQSDALNKGISMARGEILAILNVDDFYEPNVLNRVSEIFKGLSEPALLVGNCNIWDDNGDLVHLNKPAKLNLSDLLSGYRANPWPVNPSAYFYHPSLHQQIGPYNVKDHHTLDVDFLLRAVQVANVRYVDEVWGNFRLIEGTKTAVDTKRGEDDSRVKSLMKSYRKTLPLPERWKSALKYEFYNTGTWRRVRHFLKEPSEFLPALASKLRRI